MVCAVFQLLAENITEDGVTEASAVLLEVRLIVTSAPGGLPNMIVNVAKPPASVVCKLAAAATTTPGAEEPQVYRAMLSTAQPGDATVLSVPMRNRNRTALPARLARLSWLDTYCPVCPVNAARPPSGLLTPFTNPPS